MSCFPCFQNNKKKRTTSGKSIKYPGDDLYVARSPDEPNEERESKAINAQNFTFRELATATKNFRQECLLGEGGFGRVYKGTLKTSGQIVAVKQLDRNGMQGNKEFLVEILMLSLLNHPNLVNLIGYCADGDQRLLVYEFMTGGSLDDQIVDLKAEQKPLDWRTRIQIAYGAAQGLEYLHDKANPPVIYRDLKTSNILLDEKFTPKLSDFGLAKLGPVGDHTRVMGTYGYAAPEYQRTGHLTTKSDVYSFGVILLELITGRRAVDTTRPADEQNLVAWAQPIFKDPKRYSDMADPLLNKQFPEKDLNQAVAIASMCLQEEDSARPLISDVVVALSFLAMSNAPIPPPSPAAPAPAPELDPSPAPEPKAEPAPEKAKEGENSETDSSDEEEEEEEVEQRVEEEDEEGSEYEDGENDEDVVVYSDGSDSSDYEDSTDDRIKSVKKSKRFSASSSSSGYKSASKRSLAKSGSSNSARLSHQESKGSSVGSVTSSTSKRIPSQKGKMKSQVSFSAKTKTEDGSPKASQKKTPSLEEKSLENVPSTRKNSQVGTASSMRTSIKKSTEEKNSQTDTSALTTDKSIKKSVEEIPLKSSKDLPEETDSSSDYDSSSDDESISEKPLKRVLSSQESSSKS